MPSIINAEKKIATWLYLCCFMVFAMAVVGAVTRLTESGLSMVEWRPLMGWIPPLAEQEWQRVYGLYRESPEFAHKHSWMEIGDFKKIFFWEWFHRLIGRLIGVVYAVPLLWFWIKGQIPAGYKWKLSGLLLLGGAQGVLGWYMVTSGLIDRPDVSHFRLAAHLALALLIFALMWWVALTLREHKTPLVAVSRFSLLHGLTALGLLSVTIIWGAFTAGLDAGMIYNSFPLMDQSFMPPEPLNILKEQSWVQFTHRWLAVLTGLTILLFAWRTRLWPPAIMVSLQIGLGIATLLGQVPVPLAALHQAGAIVLLALMLQALRKVKNGLS